MYNSHTLLDAIEIVRMGSIKKIEIDDASIYRVKDIIRVDIKCNTEVKGNGKES